MDSSEFSTSTFTGVPDHTISYGQMDEFERNTSRPGSMIKPLGLETIPRKIKDLNHGDLASFTHDTTDQLSSISKWKERIFKSRILSVTDRRKRYWKSMIDPKSTKHDNVDPINQMPEKICLGCENCKSEIKPNHRKKIQKFDDYLTGAKEDWDKGYLENSGMSVEKKKLLLESLDNDRIYLKVLLEDEGLRNIYLRSSDLGPELDTKNYSFLWIETLMARFATDSKKIRTWIVMALNYLEDQCTTIDKLDFWHTLRNLTLVKTSADIHGKAKEQLEQEIEMYFKCLRYLKRCTQNRQFKRVVIRGSGLIKRLLKKRMPNFARLRLNILCDLYDAVGLANLQMKQFVKAIDFFADELMLGEKKKLPNAIFRALDNIGLLFAMKGEYQNAIYVWTKRLPSLESQVELAWLNFSLGQCYAHLKNYRVSFRYANQGLVHAKKGRSLPWEICSHILIAHNETVRESDLGPVGLRRNLFSALDSLFSAFTCATCLGDKAIQEIVAGLFIQALEKLQDSDGHFEEWKKTRESGSHSVIKYIENFAENGGSLIMHNTSNKSLHSLIELMTGKEKNHNNTEELLFSQNSGIKKKTRKAVTPLLQETVFVEKPHRQNRRTNKYSLMVPHEFMNKDDESDSFDIISNKKEDENLNNLEPIHLEMKKKRRRRKKRILNRIPGETNRNCSSKCDRKRLSDILESERTNINQKTFTFSPPSREMHQKEMTKPTVKKLSVFLPTQHYLEGVYEEYQSIHVAKKQSRQKPAFNTNNRRTKLNESPLKIEEILKPQLRSSIGLKHSNEILNKQMNQILRNTINKVKNRSAEVNPETLYGDVLKDIGSLFTNDETRSPIPEKRKTYVFDRSRSTGDNVVEQSSRETTSTESIDIPEEELNEDTYSSCSENLCSSNNIDGHNISVSPISLEESESEKLSF